MNRSDTFEHKKKEQAKGHKDEEYDNDNQAIRKSETPNASIFPSNKKSTVKKKESDDVLDDLVGDIQTEDSLKALRDKEQMIVYRLTLLTMDNVPWQSDVKAFSEALARKSSGEYEVACEHARSCCVLLAKVDKFKINAKLFDSSCLPQLDLLTDLCETDKQLNKQLRLSDFQIIKLMLDWTCERKAHLGSTEKQESIPRISDQYDPKGYTLELASPAVAVQGDEKTGEVDRDCEFSASYRVKKFSYESWSFACSMDPNYAGHQEDLLGEEGILATIDLSKEPVQEENELNLTLYDPATLGWRNTKEESKDMLIRALAKELLMNGAKHMSQLMLVENGKLLADSSLPVIDLLKINETIFVEDVTHFLDVLI
ncbi:hypothetical protein ZIOFF_048805 [Zingiber officinale]|uniref:tRNA wybutosine-synthesis domain-containing protein n=1 Tax=Zingiber officinale TaxID=94328 RepID=A0A8J5KSW8_ZINOF|nr:hypothetical protein ZIOFF_048805 [Zingiber officinale]